MPKRTIKIAETLELVIKRISGKSQAEVAREFDVSPQTIQYYESKETTKELKAIVLKNAAEIAGRTLGQQALGKALSDNPAI